MEHQICGNPNCATCREHRTFEMPEAITEALKTGRLALFAGAGISTEGRGVFPSTFYEEIAGEIGISLSEDISFPALMSLFCERRGRRELLVNIKKRLDYLNYFPEVRRAASRFHGALATIPFIEEIFTTNWDDLFEAECAATPMVTGDDYAFWDLPGRKVFKLHGSASHYGSIIATEEDYARCLLRLQSGLIGSSLKLALATRTILFAGYSIRDSDFLQVLHLVKEEIGNSAPAMYALTLSEADRSRLEALGLRVIVTDATYFIEELKKKLVSDGVMLEDTWREDLVVLLDLANEAHRSIVDRFNCVEYPQIIYTLCYQDGLIHGIELLLARAKSGDCSHSCYLMGKLDIYDQMRAQRKRERRYSDVAYIDGYSNALLLPLAPPDKRLGIPLYYLFGLKDELYTLDELESALPGCSNYHRAAYKHAREVVNRRGNDPEIIYHHSPWL